jgi:predicted nucleic acid-binding Zn ribbon protein
MKLLADLLPGTLETLGLAEGLAGWQAVREWPQIVGERIARRTHARSYRDGILLVEVDGSAWLQELGYLKRELVAQLNRRLGSNRVRGLHLVMTRGGIQR